MSKKANVDERAVIERYEECETARIVAQEFGVSTETIYRILRRNDIWRTHRHPKKPRGKWVSNCRSKFCPSLIVMLRTVLDMDTSDISKLMDCHLSTVSNVIARRGLQRKKPVSKKDVDMKMIEREYLDGASTYYLGEKYGVNHATIGKWMRELGHIRGKGKGPAFERANQKKREEADAKIIAEFGANIETGKKGRAYRRELRMALRKRDVGVTWQALAQRKGNLTCEVCGIECNPNDKTWGSCGPLHPSVDHIIRIVDGGEDTFDNSRLVCCSCNLKLNVQAEKEVKTHAKEQAITYQCA